jgi:hypothetical protein
MKKVFLFSTLALGGLLGWVYLANSSSLAFGALQDPDSTASKVWLWVGGYIVTLIGVSCGSAYRTLQRQQSQTVGNVARFLSNIFRQPTSGWAYLVLLSFTV